MIGHAIAYAARGWRVLPLHGVRDGARCTCGAPDCYGPRSHAGKHPAIGKRRGGNGYLDATTDLGALQRLWDEAHRTYRDTPRNVGIATGRASGVVVVDVDARHGGYETMAALVAAHGPLPATLRARTGNGVHVYFAAPSTPLRSASNVLGAGVDVRAEGGLIVAPPSLHPSGARYRWINQCEPAPMPEWAIALSERSAPVSDPFKGARVVVPVDVDKRARAWLATVEPAIQGSNGSATTMHAAAGLIRGFCLDPRTAFDLLASDYNPRCQPPWSERELTHKVESAAQSPKPLGYLLNAPRRAS